MRDRKAVRHAIVEAIGALRRDDHIALERFWQLAESSTSILRHSVLELAEANVAMLLTLSGQHDDVVFTLSSQDDDGVEVSIDDLDPCQRTTVRVLLALANDCPADAELQLELAGAAIEPAVIERVFLQTMSWTLELLGLCEDADRPVPEWLRPVLVRH